MSDDAFTNSEIILYKTEDDRTCVQCRFENETLWLFESDFDQMLKQLLGKEEDKP